MQTAQGNFEHALNGAIKGITHVSALPRELRFIFLGDKMAIFGYQIRRSSSISINEAKVPAHKHFFQRPLVSLPS